MSLPTSTNDVTARKLSSVIDGLWTKIKSTFAKPGDITTAIQALDVSSVGGDGKYISVISETDGKISATATTMDTTPTANSTKAVTSGGIKTALDGKSSTSHTHSVQINGSTKTIAATGGTAINLGTYTEFAHVSDTSVIGNDSPAADCKTYFANNVTKGSCKIVYCKNGKEYTIIFSKQSSGNYGNIIKYGYIDRYIYILRYQNTVWQSEDWEKISSGYSDTSGKLGTADKGSTTKPIYLVSGAPTECTTYAGGTAVTLNNSSKAGSTASFYAPTAGGTANYVLIGNGATSAPTWAEKAPKAVVTDYPVGFSSRTTSWSWGTLTTANGYTQITDWHTGNGSDISFAEKSDGGSSQALSVQIDGKFYQNEGQYRVLDTSNVSVPTTVPTLAWNTESTLATIDGKNIKVKLPASPDTDVKVTQTADNSSTGTGFEVLFSATADNTTRTEASRKSSKLTFQPSTGTLTATKFSGPLTGNVTGNCSGSSGSCTGNSATATSAGKLTTARKAYVTLGTASTTTTVDWSADPTTIPVDGTLAVSHGGTGMTTSTNVNAVVIGNSTTATNAMQTVRTGNGAFYATAQDAKPQFGTLPAAQGGTGKTSAKDACNAFINALDTGSSTPVDADYYVSQYVSGGTTTTTYHRRPMSALWTYIKGKLTSVSGVNISGNAATATSATSASSASKVANKLTLKIKTGTTEGTDLYTYDGSGAKTLNIKQGSNITLTAAAGSLTIAGTADTKNTAGSTDTSSKIFLIGATSQATNPQTYSQDTTYVDTDATLASTKVRVAEKCTLQFNTTTNALDFVFA